uniref:Endonuclease/exonuclease/phosphatase domain-containing protein n=1 Tax=Octopus bimaculoides TaxID=37653 RepID=A0A0L8G2K8_OCTBM
MISSLRLPDITLEGETRGPEDVSNATAEEVYASPSTSSQLGDDGGGLNPSTGHLPPDGPGVKRGNIHLRKELIIATLNVRGPITGKLNVITSEMKRCGEGRLVDVMEWDFDVQRGDPISRGINPVNDRIVTIRMRGHSLKTILNQVYAPTSEACEEEMQHFYDVVQQTLDNVPRTDVIILVGDWNAKVGKSITNSSSVVGNTIFQHHPRRLYTWTSPGDRFRNQIDYILIQGRWRLALKNIRTRPGADCGSDHQLLYATIKIRMRSRRKQTKRTWYNVTKILEAFRERELALEDCPMLLSKPEDTGITKLKPRGPTDCSSRLPTMPLPVLYTHMQLLQPLKLQSEKKSLWPAEPVMLQLLLPPGLPSHFNNELYRWRVLPKMSPTKQPYSSYSSTTIFTSTPNCSR